MEIEFYFNKIGAPFATGGKYIATWLGRVNGVSVFGCKTIRRFEKENFPVSRLTKCHGMPQEYVTGLTKALKFQLRKENNEQTRQRDV